MDAGKVVATFSIVACEPASESWGVAVQSRFLAAGAVVPWATAGVGAVATQALANPRFGPLGLAMLEEGMSAQETVDALVAGDGGRELRQVGVVDRRGRAAAFTGGECFPWAGHVVGEFFCCQGNILVGGAVIDEMAAAFERARGLPFPERLVAVLEAGQGAGGDSRGQQSGALLVVRRGGGFAGYSDRLVDLRVDDHEHPIAELARLLRLHREVFGGG
jgi:uncharacterized Ntn-hydrolase superfamily protein